MSMLLDLSRFRGGTDRLSRRFEVSQFGADDQDFRVAAPVELEVELHKDAKKVRLVGTVKTTLTTDCSRCLESFAIPLDAAFDSLFLPATENTGADEAEVASEDLGVSFYRDDYAKKGLKAGARRSALPFDVAGARIVLIDDVLYTGRSTRAAINELFDYGRPASIELAVLVDRGGRELPIEPAYVGARIACARVPREQLHRGAGEQLVGRGIRAGRGPGDTDSLRKRAGAQRQRTGCRPVRTSQARFVPAGPGGGDAPRSVTARSQPGLATA